MQHPRGVAGLTPGGVSVWTRDAIVRLPPDEYRALIDEAGARSARAQGPGAHHVHGTSVGTAEENGTRRQSDDNTPAQPLIHPRAIGPLLEDQRLYLVLRRHAPARRLSVLVGILKVGPKRLFIPPSGGMRRWNPVAS